MSNQETPIYLIPIVHRPPPLSFRIVPINKAQPWLMAGCGHRVWRRATLMVGEQVVREILPALLMWPGYLPAWLQRFVAQKQCFLCEFEQNLKDSIVCAYCDELIFPGEPVSIHSPVGVLPEGFKARATETQGGFIGCMGMECCPTAAFFAGHWMSDGVHTPFRSGSVAAQAFQEGGQVVVHQITSPR